MELLNKNKNPIMKFIKNKENRSLIAVYASLVLLFIVFGFSSEYFLTTKNLSNLLKYSAILGITSCGYTLVIISGSLDLSTGSICALCATYSAYFIQLTDSWVVGLIAGILIGVLCGVINAFIITEIKVNPLITTLGTMTIFRGIAYLANNGQSIMVYSKDFKKIGQGSFLSIPNAIWYLFIAFILVFILLKYTKFGRNVYSVGGNSKASYLAGINVKRTNFLVYVIVAVCAGISGILYASITGSGAPNGESELALEAISAVVLGGAVLSGGKGTVVGTFGGMMILATISNGLSLIGVNSFVQMICKGLILIVSVAFGCITIFKQKKNTDKIKGE